jgi:hypothetical protein
MKNCNYPYAYDIVEVTGIPCIGKSTYIRSNNFRTIDDLLNSSKIMRNAVYLYFLAKSNILTSISICDMYWLFKSSMKVKVSVLTKLNIFRNCLIKFSYYSYLRNSQEISGNIVIDEGISHIPFLLQDQANYPQILEEFYCRFSKQLSCISVVCLNANVDTIERLMSRGHKRIKSNTYDEVKKFNDMNKRTLKEIIRRSDRYKFFSMITVE